MTKFLHVSLCAAVFLTSPGLPAFAAMGQVKTSPAPGRGVPFALPTAKARLAPLSNEAALAVATLNMSPAPPSPFSAPTPATDPAASAKTAAAQRITAAHDDVAGAVAELGAVDKAPSESAATLGGRLELLLLGFGARSRSTASLAPPADAPADPLPGMRHLAKPAGDSIRRAVEASAGDSTAPSVPTPPSGGGADSDGSAPRGNGPLIPRLLASAIALTPAYFLGLPLLTAQAYLVGGLLIVSSIGMALMPLLGPDAPKALRAVPGLALAATGLTALGVAVSLSLGLGVPTSTSLMAPGLFALIGGWGLTRYGVSGPRHRFDKLESVTAFFGGIAALTGMGLAALGPTGWATTGLLWLSYPLSMMLWAHLPGWVGAGVSGGFRSLYDGVSGALRIVGAVRRDTVLFERLQRFSARMSKAWKGNRVWLGILIWGPLLTVEGVMLAAAAASGLLVGLAQVPARIVWGAAHRRWPGSRAEVLAAEWARPAFDHVSNGKKVWFNRIEIRLLPLANSSSFLTSALGALGIRALQVAWLLLAPAASAALAVAGLLRALTRFGTAYNDARHNPSHLRVSRDDSPGEKPQLPEDGDAPAPEKTPLAAKVFTALLALAPAAFFGLPLLTEGLSVLRVAFFFPAALSLALLPFLGKTAPGFLHALPGRALLYNGVALLASGHGIIAGLIALLGGWAYQTYLRKEGRERFDEFEVAAFFGALGAVVAVGAAWTGMGGWLGWSALGFGALTSPFLLQHLPRWVGSGLSRFFHAILLSMDAFRTTLSFWYRHEFRRNMSAHASYWLDKHWTHGIWLGTTIWIPAWTILAAEALLAIGLGAVFGAARAPFAFVAGALDRAKPKSPVARFFNGLVDGWFDSADGSKDVFDRVTARLQVLMRARHPVSSRPTLVAALALLVTRVAQVLWLAGVLVMLPLGFFYGLYRGLQDARKTPPPDYL